MAPAIRQLSRLQVGRETARGTAVTPTRRLHYRSARQSVETDLDTFEDEDSGTIAASWYPPAVTGQGTGYVLEMPLDLRQALLGVAWQLRGPVEREPGDFRLLRASRHCRRRLRPGQS